MAWQISYITTCVFKALIILIFEIFVLILEHLGKRMTPTLNKVSFLNLKFFLLSTFCSFKYFVLIFVQSNWREGYAHKTVKCKIMILKSTQHITTSRAFLIIDFIEMYFLKSCFIVESKKTRRKDFCTIYKNFKNNFRMLAFAIFYFLFPKMFFTCF